MSGTSTTSFLLSAADVSWGRRERNCIETVADVAGSLGGTSFNINAHSASGEDKPYYVWFDTGADSDPAPVGRTGIEVSISANDTAEDVATALAAAMEAESDFRGKVASNDSGAVLVDSEFIGAVSPAADVDSGFSFTQVKSGLGGDLGRTSGGVEVSMETTTVQITSDQTGALVNDEVVTGQTVEVTMSLQEMTAARWETVVGSVTGDTFTPAGGTQLVGFGESRLYDSFVDLGGELVLHPTRKDASDKSFDITVFLSAPKPSSINFSGENPQVMEVTFTALLEKEVQSSINLMAFGDTSQDVRV